MVELSEEFLEQIMRLRRAVERLLGVEPDTRSLANIADDLEKLADQVDKARDERRVEHRGKIR